MSPLLIAAASGLAALTAIALRAPGADIAALAVGLGALALQAVTLAAER